MVLQQLARGEPEVSLCMHMCDRRCAPEQRFGTLQEQDVPDAQQMVCASTDTSLQRFTHLAQKLRLLCARTSLDSTNICKSALRFQINSLAREEWRAIRQHGHHGISLRVEDERTKGQCVREKRDEPGRAEHGRVHALVAQVCAQPRQLRSRHDRHASGRHIYTYDGSCVT